MVDGSPELIKAAALTRYNEAHGTNIVIRQVHYLHNRVEPDHRAVNRVPPPLQGFKSFHTARRTLIGIALLHMLRKGPMDDGSGRGLTPAAQCYSLAA
jgi:putative transposase